MNNPQHNWLDMFKAVIKHAADYQTITDLNTAFKNGIIALGSKVAAIEQTAGEQEEEITGVAKDKEGAREALNQISFGIVKPVAAYAVSVNNNTLRDQMNHPITTIERIHDDEIAPWAAARLATVDALVNDGTAPLLDYGIDAATIAAWQAAIDGYTPHTVSPRVAIVHRKSLTDELADQFKDANDHCNDFLDALAVWFKADHAHYYSDYLNARDIVDLGKGTTILEVLVTDSVEPTPNPIWKADVRVDQLDALVDTDTEGLGRFIQIPRGDYTITVTKRGFVSHTSEPFTIKQGTTVRMDVALVAV